MSTRTEPVVAATPSGAPTRPILDVRDLTVQFRRRGGAPITVVDGLSLRLEPGRAHALVGESGSGKSVSMRALLGLLPPSALVSGHAVLDKDGRECELVGMTESGLQCVRGRRVGLVFQNATDALNPTITLQRQLSEPLLWHGICNRAEAKRRAVIALAEVGIPEPERRVRMYPFQLSGGMRQRAMIAMAMIARPDVLIADEPTTAVDVTVQRQILDLLRQLKSAGTAIILITHDLGVARYLCDDISVLYAGQVLERTSMSDLLEAPRHPYSQGLLGSAVDVGDLTPLRTIPGQPPDMARLPSGCRFAPRCSLAEEHCSEPQQLVSVPGGDVRCWKVVGHA